MIKDRIVIALAGHTNSGKTTLLRTLTKRPFGEVRDEANTTVEPEPAQFDTLYATIIDCPGFQDAGGTLMAIKHGELPSTMSDQIALKALQNVDVVLYVASLATVPDDSHLKELDLIKMCCDNNIAILNQYRIAADIYGEDRTDARVRQWEKLFKDPRVRASIIFDAHWDKGTNRQRLQIFSRKSDGYCRKTNRRLLRISSSSSGTGS